MNNLEGDNTNQRNFWSGDFGNQFTLRNNSLENSNKLMMSLFGSTFEKIADDFFVDIDKNVKILEIGCNRGLRLQALQKLGFTNLHGLEINKEAFTVAKENFPDINFINSSFEDFLANENEYDLVFTSYVLIHMNPNFLNYVAKKMIKITKKYIFGLEYYSDTITEVNYRGNSDVLWKQNFPKLFIKFPNMSSIHEKKFFYKSSNLCDIAYLLIKKD